MLATGRFNDDGSQNVVVGVDGTWTPTAADQITAQFVRSETRNPQRPDLLDVWTGERLAGSAGSLAWMHSSNDWYGYVTFDSYSRYFRTWNGFVTQVGVSSVLGIVDFYRYPDAGSWITQWGPELMATRKTTSDGKRVTQWLSPGFNIRAEKNTLISLHWYPQADALTLAGASTYSLVSLSISSTPLPWMPEATLTVNGGEMVDYMTGAIGHGFSSQGTLPLRFSRFEIKSVTGYQTLRGARLNGTTGTLFTERTLQMTTTWHFSSRLNLRMTHQRATFDAVPAVAGLESAMRMRSNSSSLLLSYQANWQTRYYVGVFAGSIESNGPSNQNVQRNQIFAKISYAFSN
jgi:hypothetical protein